MNNSKTFSVIPTLGVLMFLVHAAFAQSAQPPPNSAENSTNSATRADNRQPGSNATPLTKDANNTRDASSAITNACSAAVGELKASRSLIEALDAENKALSIRLATEKQVNALQSELNATRKNETDALRSTVAAKNETIAAKDSVINAQEKLIETLKNKKRSPLARVADILIGAAIFAVLK